MSVIPVRRNVVGALALIMLALGGLMAWLGWNSTRPVLAPIGPARVRPQIVGAAGTVIMLAPDGSLWGWGDNRHGVLGAGLPVLVPRPCRISTATNWTTVTVDTGLGAAVRADGTLWTWGRGGTGPAGGFQQVNDDHDWRAVGAGHLRAAASKTNGTLWTWGPGLADPAIDGSTYPRQPVQLGTSSNWLAIPAGFYHSFGIQQDGSLWVFGYYPLKPGPSRLGADTNWVAVQNGPRFGMARKADGSWWVRGPSVPLMLDLPFTRQPTQLVCLPQAERWEVVAAGGLHVLGLTRNGAMRTLGFNDAGQLGDGTTSNRSTPVEIGSDKAWVAIGAGRGFSVALAADGSLWTWG
jgi:alpha-tubulin suppressor-like RCC1 family protein